IKKSLLMPPVVLVRQIRRLAPKPARRMRFAVGRDTGQVQARVFINQFASIECKRLRSSDGMIENNAIFCHRYLSLSERKYRRLSVSFQGPGLTNLSLYQSRRPKRHQSLSHNWQYQPQRLSASTAGEAANPPKL